MYVSGTCGSHFVNKYLIHVVKGKYPSYSSISAGMNIAILAKCSPLKAKTFRHWANAWQKLQNTTCTSQGSDKPAHPNCQMEDLFRGYTFIVKDGTVFTWSSSVLIRLRCCRKRSKPSPFTHAILHWIKL